MKRLLLATLGCAAGLSMTACSTMAPSKLVEPAQWQNQPWNLVAIDGKTVQSSATLEVNDESQAVGDTGCNRFFGFSSMQATQFRVEKMGMTRMACLDSSRMQVEQIVTDVLTNWSEVSMQDGHLIFTAPTHTLTYQSGTSGVSK